jgi:hypothetical protein
MPGVSGNAQHNVSGNALPNHGAHATVVTLTIEIIGVGLMAVLAETSPKMGKLMVTIMGGFMLMWFMVNASYFASIIGKAGKYTGG